MNTVLEKYSALAEFSRGCFSSRVAYAHVLSPFLVHEGYSANMHLRNALRPAEVQVTGIHLTKGFMTQY